MHSVDIVPGQPGVAETVDVMFVICRKAPDGEFGSGERNGLRNAGGFQDEAVVGATADRDRDPDRNVDRGGDERQAGGFFFIDGFDVVDRRRAEHRSRCSFIGGDDADGPRL